MFNNLTLPYFVEFIHTSCIIDTLDFFKYVDYNMTALERIYWTGYIKTWNIEGRIYVPEKHYKQFKCFIIHNKNDVIYREYNKSGKYLRLNLLNDSRTNLEEKINCIRQIIYNYAFYHLSNNHFAQRCTENYVIFIINKDQYVLLFKNMVVNSKDIEELRPLLYNFATIEDLEISSNIQAVELSKPDIDATNNYYIHALSGNIQKSLFKNSEKTVVYNENLKEVRCIVPKENCTDTFVINFELYLFKFNPQLLENIDKKYKFVKGKKSVYFKPIKKIRCNQCQNVIKEYVLDQYTLKPFNSRCTHTILQYTADHPFFKPKEEINHEDKTEIFFKKRKLPVEKSYDFLNNKLSKKESLRRVELHLGVRKRKVIRLKIKNKKQCV